MKENLFEPNCIRTNSGIYLNLLEPTSDMITIEDIAHGLSNIPRFGGQLEYFYSVAQHSIFVCSIVSPEDRLEALLHDASEAYIGDMPSPLKKLMPEYRAIEENLMRIIAKKFGFAYPMTAGVKKCDIHALEAEWRMLFLFKNHASKSPSLSKQEFLTNFRNITEKRDGKTYFSRKLAGVAYKFGK